VIIVAMAVLSIGGIAATLHSEGLALRPVRPERSPL
jgi:hypothetical protein